MFAFLKSKNDSDKIVAITGGELIAIENVKDEVFSRKMMGDGVAFCAEENEIGSPCDGRIMMIFPTGHTFGVKRKDGVEFLVHIGIDTVELQGEGFYTLKKKGDVVKAGEPVIKVDFDRLRGMGYDMTVMLVVTENAQKEFCFIPPQKVKIGQVIAK